MKIDNTTTALVVTDPQNDFLSENGAAPARLLLSSELKALLTGSGNERVPVFDIVSDSAII